jgi:hypothetical protein
VSSTTEKVEGNSVLGRNRRPGEWNWEGVWEDRVRKAVKASLSEPALYGAGIGEDIVRFMSRLAKHILTALTDPLSRGRSRDDGENEEATRGGFENCRSITSRGVGSNRKVIGVV